MQRTYATKNTPIIHYHDCILGKVGAPTDRKQKALFQLLMILSMAPLTMTLNWVMRTPCISWESFLLYLPFYPLMLGIVIAVRFLVANPFIDKVVAHLIAPHLKGVSKSLAISLTNTFIMGSIVAFIRTLIVLGGLEGFSWEVYGSSLPLSFLMSFCIGYFFMSPLMKKFFAKSITPRMHSHPAQSKKVFSALPFSSEKEYPLLNKTKHFFSTLLLSITAFRPTLFLKNFSLLLFFAIKLPSISSALLNLQDITSRKSLRLSGCLHPR